MPVDPTQLAAFALAAVVISVVPGPDMMFVVASGLRHGPRGGVVAAAGIVGGMVVHTAAAVLGLSALLQSSAAAFDVIRLAGAAYLVALAIAALRQSLAPAGRAGAASAHPRLRRVARQAAVTNLLNPKVIVFYVAFLPQFVDPGRGSVTLQLFVLAATFMVIGFVIDALIGAAAGGSGRRLAHSQRARRLLDRVAAAVYIGLAARLVADR